MRRGPSLSLELQPILGASFHDVAAAAVRVAVQLDVLVLFGYGDFRFRVGPDAEVRGLVQQYEDLVERTQQ